VFVSRLELEDEVLILILFVDKGDVDIVDRNSVVTYEPHIHSFSGLKLLQDKLSSPPHANMMLVLIRRTPSTKSVLRVPENLITQSATR